VHGHRRRAGPVDERQGRGGTGEEEPACEGNEAKRPGQAFGDH
jgi:hypothetical protein